ncbi:hypothetical protein NKH99_31135 [Mesorhizobium sp. M0854]
MSLLFGHEPVHEGETLSKAMIETVERLTRCPAAGARAGRPKERIHQKE